tara:strand:- start:44 stop:451 length:408 start_codon:yes stop_codon:yes gene_type:complete
MFMLTACSLPFSSGALEGTVTPVPETWADIVDADVIQIETQPADPYSVNLWITVMGNVPYIHAGANRATWVEHLEENPQLLLGHEGALYELEAERVTSSAELDRLSEVYKAKYGNYPRNMNIDEIYLYRLLPRAD